MQELRYNSVNTVALGPIVSVSNLTTPVETLDLSTADVAEIFVNNSAAAHGIASNSLTTVAAAPGYYWVDLSASNCSVLGRFTIAIGDDSLIVPYSKDCMVVTEYEWDRKYDAGGVNGGKLSGVPWYGTVSRITTTAVYLGASHGLAEGQMHISLTGGTDALSKARICTLSGDTLTVDPTWSNDSETVPSGTVTAYITSMPQSTVSSLPDVNATQVGGTAQTAGDIVDMLSDASTSLTSILSTVSSNVASLLSYDLGNGRLVQEGLFALRNRVQLGESKATIYKTDDTTAAFTVDVTRSNLSNIGDFNPT